MLVCGMLLLVGGLVILVVDVGGVCGWRCGYMICGGLVVRCVDVACLV